MFGSSNISVREVIIISILQGFEEKNAFLRGGLGSSSRYKLEILHQFGKRAKSKIHYVLGANSYVCRSCRGKTGRRTFFVPSPPF